MRPWFPPGRAGLPPGAARVNARLHLTRQWRRTVQRQMPHPRGSERRSAADFFLVGIGWRDGTRSGYFPGVEATDG